jgi:hypothetical protein
MRWAGHVARMGAMRNVYSILVGKPKVKRPRGRPRRRWEDGWEGVDWMHVAQDTDRWRAVVNTVMNLRVPQKAENFFTS